MFRRLMVVFNLLFCITMETFETKEIHEDDIPYTSDWEYDLFEWGYLNPENILKNQEDIDEVNKAIKILEKYKAIWDKNNWHL